MMLAPCTPTRPLPARTASAVSGCGSTKRPVPIALRVANPASVPSCWNTPAALSRSWWMSSPFTTTMALGVERYVMALLDRLQPQRDDGVGHRGEVRVVGGGESGDLRGAVVAVAAPIEHRDPRQVLDEDRLQLVDDLLPLGVRGGLRVLVEERGGLGVLEPLDVLPGRRGLADRVVVVRVDRVVVVREGARRGVHRVAHRGVEVELDPDVLELRDQHLAARGDLGVRGREADRELDALAVLGEVAVAALGVPGVREGLLRLVHVLDV